MRLKNLDILRGVAILLVLGEHKHVSDLWTRAGWTGVDLFFVLSGFLISGLLFTEYKKHGEINIGRFLARRGLKIYPGYYILLFYYFSRNLLQGRPISKQMALQLVFLQNYGPGPVDYTWSLAVEEHFYGLLPLCLVFLYRRHTRADWTQGDATSANRAAGGAFHVMPTFIAIVTGLLIVSRILTGILLPYDNRTHHFPTHLRADSLLFGVMIAYYYHFRPEAFGDFIRRRPAQIFLVSSVLLLSAALLERTTFVMHTVGFSALYIGFGGLLALSVPPKAPDPADRPSSLPGETTSGSSRKLVAAVGQGLAFVGYHSYAIYLWHAPVASGGMKLIRRATGDMHAVVEFAFYVAASITMGVAMTKLVEAPMLRLRDRIWPTRGAPV
jgi:peptidoglycan/LPS O-acetylase OafA/YrhL